MDFLFIRPELLWLLIPWFALTVFLTIKRRIEKKTPVIASHLAHVMLAGESKSQRNITPLLVSVFMLIAIICSAGPSFEKQKVPVYTAKHARVLIMDMSYSMYATDIKPNRLMQARFKALDMVELFKEGETALIAYAGDAFTVSPLTNDATTLTNLIPSLSPEIMPSKGSNVLSGIDEAKNLLKQAGYGSGDIILITDGLEQSDVDDIKNELKGSPYTLNIYGIGTEQGAPISVPEGGFLKDNYGQIVVPKINFARLNNLARIKGGQFVKYSPSSEDIHAFKPAVANSTVSEHSENKMLWHVDAGQYGLLILVPLALLIIRRAGVSLAVLLLVLLPQEHAYAFDWQSYFKNTDQNALSAYQANDFENASKADNKEIKGAAMYKSGDFEGAANVLKDTHTATGQYNYGNALAKANKFEPAIKAYEKALELDPYLEAAKKNKALLERLQQQQQQQQQEDSQSNSEDQQQQQNQDSQQQDSQQNQNQQKQGQQDQQQSQSEQSSESEQNSEQSSSEQQAESSEQGNENEPKMDADPESAKEQNSTEKPASEQQSVTDKKDELDESKNQNMAQQPTPSEPTKEQSEQAIGEVSAKPLTKEEREKAQQLNQLLRKVPDDPAILLRNKMQLEAQQRLQQQRRRRGVEKSW